MRDFTEQTGPAVPVPSSPQVFRLFFTSAILEYIVTKTNWYARLEVGIKNGTSQLRISLHTQGRRQVGMRCASRAAISPAN